MPRYRDLVILVVTIDNRQTKLIALFLAHALRVIMCIDNYCTPCQLVNDNYYLLYFSALSQQCLCRTGSLCTPASTLK